MIYGIFDVAICHLAGLVLGMVKVVLPLTKHRGFLFSSSPRNFNRWLVSFQSFITSKDFNFIS